MNVRQSDAGAPRTTYRALGNRVQRGKALASLPDLSGKVALVTGGTDGVGRSVIDQLARAGAVTVLTARDAVKAERVCSEVLAACPTAQIHVVPVDLADLASVRAAAGEVLRRWDRLDLLICNAGYLAQRTRSVSADGHEMGFAVNHLAHALLIQLLADRLRSSAPSRVVIVASEAHRRARGGLDWQDLSMESGRFRPQLSYARSKLANVLYARELGSQLAGTGVDVRSAHPGGVDTAMMRQNFSGASARLYPLLRKFLFITPDEAADGLLRVALDPDLDGSSGDYYEVGIAKLGSARSRDRTTMQKLWAVTDTLLAPGEGDLTGPRERPSR